MARAYEDMAEEITALRAQTFADGQRIRELELSIQVRDIEIERQEVIISAFVAANKGK